MLKGMGIGAIVKLVLAVMIASLFVSLTTIGSLGQALQQSFDNINRVTDFTTEIDDKNTLSDLTRFVQDRAMNEGCKRVDNRNSEDGYPGLEGTRLTDRPQCFGGQSTILRGLTGATPFFGPDQNYMPGIYSRERFEVTQNFSLDTREYEEGDPWIENPEIMGTAFDRNIEVVADAGDESWDEEEGLSVEELAGSFAGGALTGGLAVPFTALGAELGRAVGDELSETDVIPIFVFYEDTDLGDRTNLDEDTDEGEVVLQFCEGDKGYIQGSRGSLKNDGYSDEEPLYPVIVVEESQVPTCGDINYGRTDLLPNGVRNEGRLLHITGETDEEFPRVRQPDKFFTKEYAFDLFELNENNPSEGEIIGSAGGNIEFNFDASRSEACAIGMYDARGSTVNSKGGIYIKRGVRIPYDGTFPDRESNDILEDNLGDRTDRSVPPRPSAQNLYDLYAEEGFVGGDWGSYGINNKILYDNSGEREFELYGDLLCAPHSNNNNFENDHSEWVMCSPEYDGVTKTVDDESWTCDSETGRWENE